LFNFHGWAGQERFLREWLAFSDSLLGEHRQFPFLKLAATHSLKIVGAKAQARRFLVDL
jgi:hypothetical protein